MGLAIDKLIKQAAGAKLAENSPQLNVIADTGTPIGALLRKLGVGKKKGGVVKSSASRRADGCAVKGKTKGRIV